MQLFYDSLTANIIASKWAGLIKKLEGSCLPMPWFGDGVTIKELGLAFIVYRTRRKEIANSLFHTECLNLDTFVTNPAAEFPFSLLRALTCFEETRRCAMSFWFQETVKKLFSSTESLWLHAVTISRPCSQVSPPVVTKKHILEVVLEQSLYLRDRGCKYCF